MPQRKIIIPADREEEPVGAQIKAILDPDTHYQVAVVSFNQPIEALTELIVPVLPSSIERAEKLLSELRDKNLGIPLLPVVRSETLNKIQSLYSWIHDFLLSPIREPE